MNPDTKQNADNAHSKKGVERNAQPLIKAGRVSPLKTVLIFTPPFITYYANQSGRYGATIKMIIPIIKGVIHAACWREKIAI